MVWLFTSTLGARGTLKMHSSWSGPWQVIRRVNDFIYEILATEETGYRRKLVVSIDRLRLYLKDQDTPNPLPQFTASLAQEGNTFLTTIPHIDLSPPSILDEPNHNMVRETLEDGDDIVTSVHTTLSSNRKWVDFDTSSNSYSLNTSL